MSITHFVHDQVAQNLIVNGSLGDPGFLEPRRVCVHVFDEALNAVNGNLVNMMFDPFCVHLCSLLLDA